MSLAEGAAYAGHYIIISLSLRDEKEPMVFRAKRWSGYASWKRGEQLDEWQLYVEGRERSYGTCAGRRDGLAMLRWKRNSWTSGNCTLRDEKEPMVFWAKRWSALERERSYGTFAGL
jgi:hypothetical protein